MIFKKTTVSGDDIIVELEGSLSGDESAAELQQILDELEQSGQNHIILNFLKVPAINSSNLGKLFLFFNKVKNTGRSLKIRGCSEALYKTFQLIEMENHIPYEREAG
ncbi:MAG TPA: anti-sigma factor antagonist [Spirochaetia bacterium]|nr:anti-sigma factor antagonist [Spirochaetia bacterium]